MMDILRRHGLICFILAAAVVFLGNGCLAAALVLFAAAAEEIRRRTRLPAMDLVRWGCLLGALGLILRR